MTPPRSTSGATKLTVRIDLVDMSTRSVQVIDSQRGRFRAHFRELSGRIPAAGEYWSAQRTGYEWGLVTKLDSRDDHDRMATNMQPGDAMMNSLGTAHVTAPSGMSINGLPMASQVRQTFRSVAAQASYVLHSTPLSNDTILVYKGTSFQHYGINYTLSGKTLTFLTGVGDAAADVSVYYQTPDLVFTDSDTVLVEVVASSAEEFDPA